MAGRACVSERANEIASAGGDKGERAEDKYVRTGIKVLREQIIIMLADRVEQPVPVRAPSLATTTLAKTKER